MLLNAHAFRCDEQHFCLEPETITDATTAFYYNVRLEREWVVFMNASYSSNGLVWEPASSDTIAVHVKRYGESVLINSTGHQNAWYVRSAGSTCSASRCSTTTYNMRSCEVSNPTIDHSIYHDLTPYLACWSATVQQQHDRESAPRGRPGL